MERTTLFRRTIAVVIGLFILIFAFASRYYLNIEGLGTDSWSYLLLARNSSNGIFDLSGCNPYESNYYQTLYAHLISILSGRSDQVASLYRAGRLLSALMGTLTCIPAFLIANRYFGFVSGMVAALFVAFFPQLVWSSGFVLTESTYVFFMCFSFYFFIKAIENDHRKSSIYSGVIAGIFCGLATLTRGNGIICLGAYGLIVAVSVLKKRSFKASKNAVIGYAFTMLSFLIVYGPYSAYLSNETGHFIYSVKSFTGLATRGTYVGYENHFQGTDLDEGEVKKNEGEFPSSAFDYYKRYPKTAFRVTLKNFLRGHFDDRLRNYPFPIAIAVLLGISIFWAVLNNRFKTIYFSILIWCATYYSIDAAILIMLERFYEPAYVLLSVLAAQGLVILLKTPQFSTFIVRTAVFIVVCFSLWQNGWPRFHRPLPEVVNVKPILSGRDANHNKVLNSTAYHALLVGTSKCTLYPSSRHPETMQKWINEIKKADVKYVICPESDVSGSLCHDLIENNLVLKFKPFDANSFVFNFK